MKSRFKYSFGTQVLKIERCLSLNFDLAGNSIQILNKTMSLHDFNDDKTNPKIFDDYPLKLKPKGF